MTWPLFVLGIILVICLIIVHEFGHFLVARRNGVEVEEFGIGFPPRIWSKKMPGGHIFSINWLLLGGFVKLKGEHDSDKSPGSFGVASLWKKTKIMLAGVTMNVVAAFVLLSVIAAIGMPQLINNQFTIKSNTKTIKQEVLVGYVEPNSPAAGIGLKDDDQLISVASKSGTILIRSANQLPNITKSLAGQTVLITYKRAGQLLTKQVTLRTAAVVSSDAKAGKQVGYIGISPVGFSLTRSTWSSPIVAAGLIGQITALTFKGIGTTIAALFRGNTTQASSQLTGPVGIVVLLKNFSLLGYQFILLLVAIISLSLAIFNVLPIPVLDGGRLFFMLIPRLITHKPIKQRTEELIAGIGLALLMLLFVLITFVDIKRYF